MDKNILAYLKREVLRKDKRQKVLMKKKEERISRVHHICSMYEDAYFKWTGEHVRLRYMHGRYYTGGGKLGQTEATIVNATNHMLAKLHEEELAVNET